MNIALCCRYLILDMADNLTQNLISHVAECRTFIDECLASGGKCLVHGNLGISRSAALVVAYVMEKRTLSYRWAVFNGKIYEDLFMCVGKMLYSIYVYQVPHKSGLIRRKTIKLCVLWMLLLNSLATLLWLQSLGSIKTSILFSSKKNRLSATK